MVVYTIFCQIVLGAYAIMSDTDMLSTVLPLTQWHIHNMTAEMRVDCTEAATSKYGMLDLLFRT